jgi:hypothetical protein
MELFAVILRYALICSYLIYFRPVINLHISLKAHEVMFKSGNWESDENLVKLIELSSQSP